MKKKKILFLITQAEFGGAQRFLLEFAARLDTRRYDILVAAGAESDELVKNLADCGVGTVPLTHLVRDVSPLKDAQALLEIRSLIRREKPDTLFLLSSKAGFLGSLAGRLAGVTRIVYRIGGWSFNDPLGLLARTAFLATERLSAGWKDVIITNSRHDADQAQKLGIRPREKLVTIYNGLDPATLNFLPREEARNALLQFAPSPGHSAAPSLWLGCIANFYETKGLPVLFDAMRIVKKTLPHSGLFVIGDGRGRLALEETLRAHGLVSRVSLCGKIPEAWRYLKAFDAFVLPSLKEGFPWVVLEAMHAGIPVIATSVGAIPEIITTGRDGLVVPPGKSGELAEAIERVLQNPDFGKTLAKNAKETVARRFLLETMLQKTEATL